MDLLTVFGIICGGSAVYYIMLKGQTLHLLFNLEAFILIAGGTIGCICIAYPWSVIKEIHKALRLTFFPRKRETQLQMIGILVSLSEKSKRQGMEFIANDVRNMKNKFLLNAVKMIGDGFEKEIIRDNMQKEIIYVEQRHQKVNSVFRFMSTVAPILGLLGTLIGVVQVLRNITDPKAMGASMARGVSATFYGIFSANFIFLPIAVKLSEYSEDEVLNMELVSEGIMSIIEGDIPLVTEKKLDAFLSSRIRENSQKETKK